MAQADLSADSSGLLEAVATNQSSSLRRILEFAQRLLSGDCKQADEAVLSFVVAQAHTKLGMDPAETIRHYQRAFDQSKGIEGLKQIRATSGMYLATLYEEAGDHDKSVAVATELSLETHHETLERLSDPKS